MFISPGLFVLSERRQKSENIPLPYTGTLIITTDPLVEHEHKSESLDEVVDSLLHDKDYLLAQELKHRVKEMNALLEQAQRQGLRLRISATHDSESDEIERAEIDLKIFKEI